MTATPTEPEKQDWEDLLVGLARRAGEAILEVYGREDFNVEIKGDDSPLTAADLAAHNVIVAGLKDTGIPVLSEESKGIERTTRQAWSAFWLVDPLDGTKEFIKRNGEFTVNIALIVDGEPLVGVVHAPVLGRTYYGHRGRTAFVEDESGRRELSTARPAAGEKLSVVASRSHRNQDTEDYLSTLPEHELVSSGSSLKFCRVADGSAHLYPRLAPTMEWDTGAAQAVLEAAGGAVVRADNGRPLRYNKDDLLNPFFIATADAAWQPQENKND